MFAAPFSSEVVSVSFKNWTKVCVFGEVEMLCCDVAKGLSVEGRE